MNYIKRLIHYLSCKQQKFGIRKDPRTGMKTLTRAIFKRKHASLSRDNIDDQLRMLPIFKLGCSNVEAHTPNFSKFYIILSRDKLIFWIAHGG